MPISKSLLFVCFTFLSAFNAHAEIEIPGAMEGVQYITVKPAQPTSAPAGKIEVTEIFWYGCSHCFKFEPYVKAWLKRKSDNIVFKRMPAMLSPKWGSHARVYYAAESMGVTEQIHEAFFTALHVDGKKLFEEKDIVKFIAGLGIDQKKFSAAYHSFAVSSKVKQAKKLTKAFNVNGVPSVVVNGKYLTSGTHAGSFEGMVYLMNALAEAELKSLPAKDVVVTKP